MIPKIRCGATKGHTLVQWLLRVYAVVILHVVYRRGCDVVIPLPPLDTYLVKGCPGA